MQNTLFISNNSLDTKATVLAVWYDQTKCAVKHVKCAKLIPEGNRSTPNELMMQACKLQHISNYKYNTNSLIQKNKKKHQ